MGISVSFLYVTDWAYLSQPRSSVEMMSILTDALADASGSGPSLAHSANTYGWGREIDVKCLRFVNWKYAWAAGQCYQDHVRPLIDDSEEKLRADRLFFALDFFGDSEGDLRPRHDLVPVDEFRGLSDGVFFSFAPKSVEQFHDDFSEVVANFEQMNLMAILPESAFERRFHSPDEWIAYLKDWIALFGDARKHQAGLIGLAG